MLFDNELKINIMLNRRGKLVLILFITILNTLILCDDIDFQDVSSNLAFTWAKKFKTSVKWIDFKAEHPDMQQFKWAKTSYKHLSTKPEIPKNLPSSRTLEIFQQWFDNPGKKEEKTTFVKSYEATNSYEWNTCKYFRNSQKESVNLTMLDSSGERVSVNMEIDFSSNQTFKFLEKKVWTFEETVVIPPKKSVLVKFIANIDSYEDYYYSSEVHIDGYVAIWFKDKIDLNADPSKQIDKHWLWFPDTKSFVSSITSSKGDYKINEDGLPVYKARGKLNAIVETKPKFIVELHDLRFGNQNELKFLE